MPRARKAYHGPTRLSQRLARGLAVGTVDQIRKQQPGKNLLMIGSTKTAHTFMQLGLIDEYRLNVNQVVLGGGNPLFADIKDQINLFILETLETLQIKVTPP